MRHITICGRDIRIEGRLVRIARLEADRYEFLDDPDRAADEERFEQPKADASFPKPEENRDRCNAQDPDETHP